MENINNNEILFFKVFNNKYLFNQIFNHIEIINKNKELKYLKIKRERFGDDFLYFNDFRIKFKEIKSMAFMVEKELYSLLKCKIIHKEEEIIISNDSIYELFSLGIEGYKFKNNIQDNIKDRELLYEIIQLLFKYRKEEIINLKLLHIALKKKSESDNSDLNFQLFKYLVLNYSLKITPELFQYVIGESTIEDIQRFIKFSKETNSNIVNEQLKNNSIECSLNNNEMVLELILNNKEYYNSYEPNNKYERYLNKIFNIKSLNLQIQLLEINYFNKFNYTSTYTNEIKEEIEILLNNLEINGYEKLKKIYQILINHSKEYEEDYLIKFVN